MFPTGSTGTQAGGISGLLIFFCAALLIAGGLAYFDAIFCWEQIFEHQFWSERRPGYELDPPAECGTGLELTRPWPERLDYSAGEGFGRMSKALHCLEKALASGEVCW